MRQRQKFELDGFGENCKLWKFVAVISKPQNARRKLKALTGNNIQRDKNTEGFFA